MYRQKIDHQKDEKVILNWLAHHNPSREDFDDHVYYIFNHAICIGCSAFILGGILGLVIGNIFYYYIINFINLPIILMIFFFCLIPSLLQYLVQIIRKKPMRNRAMKFLIRFLYPIGSIIFIFKSPLWGFCLSIPAGYLIIYIRKIKNRILKET